MGQTRELPVLEREAPITELLLKSFFNNAAAGLALLDAELRFLQVNGTLADMNGVSIDAHLGRTVVEVLPELAPNIVPLLQRVLRTGEPMRNIDVRGETPRLPGVSRQWIESFFPVQGRNGEIQGVGAIVVETTERRRAEERSREHERRFREMLENAALIAMTLDCRGIVTFCNDHLARVTGWKREEVVGTDWFERFIPPTGPDMRKIFFETIAQGEIPSHFENPIKTRTGEWREIAWNNTVLRDGAGNVVGTASIGEDVTDRRRAEAGLRASEQRFREVVENIREVYWLTTPDKNVILYVSPAYEKIWGRSCDSLRTTPQGWLEAVHPDDRPRIAQAITRQAEGTYEEEYRVVRPDGEVRWVRDRAFPVPDHNGSVLRIAGVAEDITDRKLAEDRRRVAEERVAAIFHASPIPIGYGSPGGRLSDVNEKFAAVLGYRRDEMIGRTVHELGMWANPNDRVPVMAELEKHGVVLNHEARLRRKSGEVRTMLLSFQKLMFGDEPVFLAMMVDVTDQKAMQAQMHRAERVESVGRLASGIAHDMNNILAPILMSAPLLRMALSAEDVAQTVDTIELSAKRGADLVRQLLTFGRRTDERGPVDGGRLIRDMWKIAIETFPKNIQVKVHTPAPDQLWPMLGDHAQLHQVLLNLCVNARDAMPHGGRLLITARNVRFDDNYAGLHPEAKPGDYVQLAVADTGMGIPPEIGDKIFDPFFTTKKVGQGTGLGLSTVASVLKAHDGFITMQSAVGQGTTFELFVPAASNAQFVAEPPEPAPPAGNDELILVVDDEASVRSVLRETLTRNRYRVVIATDGADALVAFARNVSEIKAVITDLDMPIMDGYNLAHAIRRMRPDVPIIISTGLSDDRGPEKRRAELDALGVTATLLKPYTGDRLLSVIHAAIARSVTPDR